VPFYEIEGVRPIVDPSAFVHPDAVLIGDVTVGAGCYVGPGASLRGDFGRIVVGAGSNVQDRCVLHCYPGADCVVHASGHIGHGAILHGCQVHASALIGINAVVLDDASVGEGALVGANSLVPAGFAVPPRTLFAGSPGRVVRELDDEALAWRANGIRVYQELARRSLASLRPTTPLAIAEADRPRLSTGRAVAVPLHEHRASGSDRAAPS
jgi:phenylacetic acid degradation protein